MPSPKQVPRWPRLSSCFCICSLCWLWCSPPCLIHFPGPSHPASALNQDPRVQAYCWNHSRWHLRWTGKHPERFWEEIFCNKETRFLKGWWKSIPGAVLSCVGEATLEPCEIGLACATRTSVKGQSHALNLELEAMWTKPRAKSV